MKYLAENTLTNSYEGLREITGQEHSQLSILDTDRFSASKSSESAAALVEQARAERTLSLLAARISQDVAKDNISLASSGHLPSLTLDGSYWSFRTN